MKLNFNFFSVKHCLIQLANKERYIKDLLSASEQLLNEHASLCESCEAIEQRTRTLQHDLVPLAASIEPTLLELDKLNAQCLYLQHLQTIIGISYETNQLL